MEAKAIKNDAIFDEKAEFSDTGSTIFANSPENQDKTSEEAPISTENSQKSTENSSFSSESKENTAKNSLFSLENEESTPNTDNSLTREGKTNRFFDEANKSAFCKDFPEVDLEKLRNRQDFQSFLTILTENPTLSQIYACFNKITASAEENSQSKLLHALANAKAGVGALSSSQDKDFAFFTKEQVMRMSPAQIKAHYKEIRQSQQRW